MPPIALFVQYTRPQCYPPLEHSSRELAEHQFRVVFLGIEGEGASKQVESTPHSRIEYRLLRQLPPGLRQKLQYVGFVGWVLGTALIERPRVVYCSDLMAAAPGLLCSWLLGLPVIYHEHDTPPEPTTATLRILQGARRALAKRALACVVPNAERRRRFDAALQPARSLLVWNCPSRLVPSLPDARKQPSPFVLWYHGSIVPTQLPLAAIDALTLLPEHVELRFAGYETLGHPGYVGELLKRAADRGVAHRVRYLGTLPLQADLYREAAKCHVGLALFARPFREPMVGASNKPWEYMACGLPLLACDDDEWRSWIVGARIGETCNPSDPASIAASVGHYMQLPDLGASLGLEGRRRIAESDWNYQAQFAPVLALVQQT